MTRIIVKNLPNKVTEEILREKFGEKGMVTDVQLKYTKDGKFRHFAFVGYATEEEAKAAIEYFNRSYFNSLRITVEPCAELGNKNKPQSWSKYAPDSSAYKKLHEFNKNEAKKEKAKIETNNPIVKELHDKLRKFKNDPAFLDFMEVHGKDETLWNNNDVESFLESKHQENSEKNDKDSGVEEDTESNPNTERKIAEDETVSDADYLKLKTGQKTLEKVREEKSDASDRYFTLVIRGLPYKTKKKTIKEFFRPLKLDSIRVPVKIKGLAYIGLKSENNVKKALLRNKSFIDGKRIFINPLKMDHKVKSTSNVQIDEKWKKQEESLNFEESVAESGRIFVRNLPYTTTEEELQPLFEKYGPVTEVIVPLDKLTRKIKGYAVITYLMPEHAVKAFNELDGIVFHGRMLHLLPGKAKESDEFHVKEDSSFKTKKMQTLKAEAGSSHNWNTLFLGSNAVANVIAANYNVSKEQILCDDNAAVRLALGETQVVHETREFLESSGVKLDAFNRAVNHRSKTVILVKNLPANTRVDEIRELFSKYGILGRVLLPPSGITGIVEFIEPSEARTAFKRLAYSKFKNLPLYLEWAPDDTFLPTTRSEKPDESEVGAKSDTIEQNEEEPEPDTTIFVKNINFQTTEDVLREHFKRVGKISSVSIAKKKDPKRPGELLSMGYGFVQFYRKRSADAALKELQQSILDEHCLELKRSNRTLKTEAHLDRKSTNVEKQTSSKILVRNVPFQAKLQELQDLFKVFGEIKALRLPKKMIGSGPHRGFAFVEYQTKEEARRAMQSLSQSTHLYGRRLVLEWAQTAEEDLDQLRKRAAERFPTSTEIRSKKSKADMIVEDDSDKDEEDEINMME